MLNDLSLAMAANLGVTSCQLAVLAIALSSSFTRVLALPTLPISQNLSLIQADNSSLQGLPYPRPPQEPACPLSDRWGTTMGRPSYIDCDFILSNLYPKDPLAKPVMRNFYTASADVSQTLNNFRLPYEQSHSITSHDTCKECKEIFHDTDAMLETCNVQVLLATKFTDVPRDEATWNDIRGAARTIFRSCVSGKGVGGIVTKNGTLLASITRQES